MHQLNDLKNVFLYRVDAFKIIILRFEYLLLIFDKSHITIMLKVGGVF
jgi:hypothetical protein